ncbi:hypothetical protein BDN72DRAFT_436327 [Pluteus cervinus]|uniref:Uncharacterized protein n=1 Tax=Pluteus cervinus TaxID=181527 RepID=A0ACD3B1M2_9AGAR|nr:hypothetical protein BDN72DRAFT_436327 [Pluteus cervinus]
MIWINHYSLFHYYLLSFSFSFSFFVWFGFTCIGSGLSPSLSSHHFSIIIIIIIVYDTINWSLVSFVFLHIVSPLTLSGITHTHIYIDVYCSLRHFTHAHDSIVEFVLSTLAFCTLLLFCFFWISILWKPLVFGLIDFFFSLSIGMI